MPYGWGRMLRLRRGMGGGPMGCPRRMSFGRGLIGTAASIVASLALNDLAKPDGYLRGTWRRLIGARSSVQVIGYEADGKEKVSNDSSQDGDQVVPSDTVKED
ncbi:MAG: hypothetical protein ABFD81_13820 [Syntrophaceae bacterium]